MVFSCVHYLSDCSRAQSTATAVEHAETLTYTRSSEFYVESLFIAVENSLFNVPRYHFEHECAAIAILSPRPREKHGMGWSEDKPITLTGFTEGEFGCFLERLLGNSWLNCTLAQSGSPTSIASLEAVMKVSTILKFERLQATTIRSMSQALEGRADTLRQIQLARAYKVPQWLVVGYTAIVAMGTTISDEDIDILGMKMGVRLLRLRDRTFPAMESRWKIIREEVEEELKDLRYNDGEFRFPVQEANSGIKLLPYHGDCCLRYVILKAEDILFRIPTNFLTSGSEVFRDLFSIPRTQNIEGETETNPIVLEGVSQVDFTYLLRDLWPHLSERPGQAGILAPEDLDPLYKWTSILKLSTMWIFQELRYRAIQEMSTLLAGEGMEMKKVTLGRSYGVQTWLMEAYLSLANRPTVITAGERQILGLEAMINLWELRDIAFRFEGSSKLSKFKSRSSCRIKEVTLADIQSKFSAT